uniref:Uncharacterized protein n=1 Tax=Arundo donax TaxID=35708 RepID=A0A0A9EUY6_ARUDO
MLDYQNIYRLFYRRSVSTDIPCFYSVSQSLTCNFLFLPFIYFILDVIKPVHCISYWWVYNLFCSAF